MSLDRTSEFMALAKTMPVNRSAESIGGVSGRYNNNDNNNDNNSSSSTPTADLKSFHSTASSISRDIAATSAMLSELTQLVRRRGLFVDDSERVNFLVVRIKSSIENLNGRLDQAAATIAQQKRRLGSQAGQEATNVVGQLKDEFVKATSGFKKVLQQRTDNLKATTDRKRDVYGGPAGGPSLAEGEDPSLVSLMHKPPVYGESSLLGKAPVHNKMMLDLTSGMQHSGEPSSSAPRDPNSLYGGSSAAGLRLRHSTSDGIPSFSGGASSFGGVGGAPMTPLDIQRMESGQEELMQLIPDQDYLRERADAMSTVETNIMELGTIFNKLAVMVSEHREMVQRVEDNVDNANQNIEFSMNSLTDTLTALRTNKALAMKVFGILVFFIVLFVTFFA